MAMKRDAKEMKHLFAIFGIALLAAGLPAQGLSGAEYVESFEDVGNPDKIMAGSLLIGSDGTWQGELRDGVYELSNSAKPGAIKYYQFSFGSSGGQSLEVSVDVEGQYDGKAAGAGVLYGFDPANRTYYAFVVSKDGSYNVWQRGPNGMRRMAGGTHDAIQAEGANKVTASLQGPMAELSVNGARVFAHSAGNAAAGGAGIIALDTGDYRFDNFRLTAE